MSLGSDGVYRWLQRASLPGNASKLPMILICAAAAALMFWIPMAIETRMIADNPIQGIGVILLLTGVVVLGAGLIYCLRAWLAGHKYLLLFELDSRKLCVTRKLTSAQDVRWSADGLTMTMAVNLPYKEDMINIMSDHEQEIVLDSVTRIKRKRGCLRLYEDFGLCRVYADSRDLEKLTGLLTASCKNLKKIS